MPPVFTVETYADTCRAAAAFLYLLLYKSVPVRIRMEDNRSVTRIIRIYVSVVHRTRLHTVQGSTRRGAYLQCFPYLILNPRLVYIHNVDEVRATYRYEYNCCGDASRSSLRIWCRHLVCTRCTQ